jgi:tetratricopeptide (TPR) repeat protein
MRYLALVARLLLDPLDAVAALRLARPVGRSLAAAVVATGCYQAILLGVHEDLIAIVRVGGFDRGGAAIVAGQIAALVSLSAAPLAFIVFLFVPTCLLLLGALDLDSRPLEILRNSFETSVAVALSMWVATLALWIVPAALLADANDARGTAVWFVLPLVFFAGWMTIGFAGIARAGYGRAAAAAAVGAAAIVLVPFAVRYAGFIAVPIVAILLLALFGRSYRGWLGAREARARLGRSLQTATLNPSDASAHTDLGLLYYERGDVDRAVFHLERAVGIDPTEIAALYQLGRIARVEGRLAEAIERFDAVVQLDAAYANAEVWREAGATYQAAGQHADAREALERFLERRPTNAEGLYLLGATLAALGHGEEARERMRAAIEVVRTAPPYKYRLERRWLTEAEEFLNREGRLG